MTLELKAPVVTFLPSERRTPGAREFKPITLNVVIAQEPSPAGSDFLAWILLTTEPTSTLACTRQITRYYERRWRIEDFHKAWKSGVGAQGQRLQSIENLEKMIVILSFAAVRLLQLKEYFEYPIMNKKCDNNTCCDEILTEAEWQVLWGRVARKSLPEEIPIAAWAYKAMAKLGDWTNSKRTGKAAWPTLWKGWFRLQERLAGLRIAGEFMTM